MKILSKLILAAVIILTSCTTKETSREENEFADRMWSVDPSVKLIAVGDLGDWDRMILTNCADKMNYISEHFYKQDYHGGGLMTHVKQIPEAIREKAVAHREYRQTIPFSISGSNSSSDIEIWRITAPDDMSTNEPGRDPVVVIEGPEAGNYNNKLKVGAASITIFRIPLKAE